MALAGSTRSILLPERVAGMKIIHILRLKNVFVLCFHNKTQVYLWAPPTHAQGGRNLLLVNLDPPSTRGVSRVPASPGLKVWGTWVGDGVTWAESHSIHTNQF